jgi:hypothetical protein
MQGSIFVAQCISPTNGVLQVKKIEALTSPILVFINFVDLARCLVDFSLQDARCTHLNYHKIYNQFGKFLVITSPARKGSNYVEKLRLRVEKF